MGNTAPLKFKRAFTIRVDQEFLDAIEDIRRRSTPIPTASEVVRQAVMDAHARRGKK